MGKNKKELVMKKLKLNKEVVTNLNKESIKNVKGGQEKYTQRNTCGAALTCLYYPGCI